jgi:hypothetical protein
MKNGKRVEAKQLYLQAKEYLVSTNELKRAKDEVFKAESKLESLKLEMTESYYGAGYDGQLVVVDQVTIECDCEGDPIIRLIEGCVINDDDWDKPNDPTVDQKLRAMVNKHHEVLEANGNP